MTKIRKQKRKKTFRYVNKKRLNNKRRKTPNIQCSVIKEAWDNRLTVQKNLETMGLAYDANMAVDSAGTSKKSRARKCKSHVAMALEDEANQPRERQLKIPKTQVLYLTYLIDKYGEDFKAMARDPKNHYQETWKQIRAKIKTFKGIPEQYNEYLKSKGIEPTTQMEIET